MVFCTNCGAELKPEDKMCSSCGTAVSNGPPIQVIVNNSSEPKKFRTASWGSAVTSEKSTFLAILLSLFITGLGTIYAGNVKKGLILLIVTYILAFTVVGLIIAIPLWFYGIYSAYATAEENNRLWREYLQS